MPGLCVNCHLILITTVFIAVHFGKSKSDPYLDPTPKKTGLDKKWGPDPA